MNHSLTHTALKLTRRLRRLRRTETMRALVRETRLSPDMFVLPLFVCEGEGVRREVASMPGVFQLSVDETVAAARAAAQDGVRAVLLFGLPDTKDDIGSAGYHPDGPGASAPTFGDRRTHQMDPANAREALREVEQDLAEGADIVMVKPALPYLDVIAKVKETFGYPTAAYHVSGEYAMLKAAAAKGWIDERRAMLECLTAIHRAGADIIITYFARDAVRALA